MKHKTDSTKKIVALTGGSGFVGTYVRELLSVKGYEILNYDLSEPQKTLSGETYIKCDITDAATLSSLWQEADYVIHLAALVGVTECQVSPPFSTLTNFMGTQNICELVRQQRNPCPIVFASSSAVYGDPGGENSSIQETTPLNPLSFYGSQKKWSEDLLKQYAKDFGLKSTALRFFNIFGAGQKFSSPYSGVISKFCYRLSQGLPLELYNYGASTRDFVHAKDVARAIFQAMIFDYAQIESGFQVVNIGTGQKTSVREIAEQLLKIAKAAGSSSELILREARSEEIAHSLASVEKAKNVLNWTPQERLEQHLPFIFESIVALSKQNSLPLS